MVVSESPLPRLQAGAQPQRLLTTLLCDYWHGRREHIPSVVLVRLLADFGVSTVGARAALSRLARRGLLESSRVGRNTYYGLTATAAEVIRESAARILSFGQRHDPWDGRWTVAAFSIPEEMRDVRHAVRSRLRWLGFAPLYDGMWVTPRPVAEAARRVFADLGVMSCTVLTTTADSRRSDPRPPMAAWDLTDLRLRYEEFIGTYSPLLDRIRRADVCGAEALVARTTVMDAWRRFPSLDPDLPLDLLPERWPRRAARGVFAEIYDGLAPHAVERVRELVAVVAPDLAPLVRRHTSVG
jgi:phenylacetic acid degradation operon negative regulatory protein